MIRIRSESGQLPVYATIGSAGADLHAAETVLIARRKMALVSTGVFIDSVEAEAFMAEGRTWHDGGDTWVLEAAVDLQPELVIRGRSSLAMKGIWTHVGTIDADYPGEIKVALLNTTNDLFIIHKGDRIAQLIGSLTFRIGGCEQKNVKRRDGFGSTGV